MRFLRKKFWIQEVHVKKFIIHFLCARTRVFSHVYPCKTRPNLHQLLLLVEGEGSLEESKTEEIFSALNDTIDQTAMGHWVTNRFLGREPNRQKWNWTARHFLTCRETCETKAKKRRWFANCCILLRIAGVHHQAESFDGLCHVMSSQLLNKRTYYLDRFGSIWQVPSVFAHDRADEKGTYWHIWNYATASQWLKQHRNRTDRADMPVTYKTLSIVAHQRPPMSTTFHNDVLATDVRECSEAQGQHG